MNRRLLLLASMAMLTAPTAALAQGAIMVMDAVVRPPVEANLKVGALYLMLMNHGSEADKLIAVSTPMAESVELHEMKVENGVASMSAVASLELPAGGMVELKSGGLHAMIMGIKGELKTGDTVPFTLTFEKAGKVEIGAKVGSATD